MSDWRLLVRNADLEIVGELDDYQRLKFVHRFQDVTTGTLEANREVPVAAELLAVGAGIVVQHDGEVVTSGPIIQPRRDWSDDGDLLTLGFVSDDAWLLRRIGYPSPTDGDHSASAYDVRTGAAETVLRAYVDANLGPSALADRRVDGLTLLADEARGAVVTGRARFHPMIELCRDLAISGGDLGFRIRQAGPTDPTTTGLLFEVYVPRDLTGTAIFSADLGNLAGFELDERAPDANYVLVAGQGEGTARTIVEGGDTDSIDRWGRIEAFRDQRDTDDLGELEQSRDRELTERASELSIKIEPVDTAAITYLADYGLGDTVRTIIDGVAFDEIIREVTVTLEGGDAPTVEPKIGTPARGELLGLFEAIRRVNRRVSRLERS